MEALISQVRIFPHSFDFLAVWVEVSTRSLLKHRCCGDILFILRNENIIFITFPQISDAFLVSVKLFLGYDIPMVLNKSQVYVSVIISSLHWALLVDGKLYTALSGYLPFHSKNT
jgi:hypothetical protein